MAFNIQAARKAGYSDQEIQQYLQGQSQSGIVGQGANVLRSIGLGAVPDILGAAQFGAQKALAGQNPFSAVGQTPQQLQQTTSGNQLINPQTTGGAAQAGQDLAGGASWMVPAGRIPQGGNVLTHILAGIGNRGIQGAGQGALNAVAQGQDPIQGAETGAIANPLLSGVGKVATDTLPRYIGFRNFGTAGFQLPEVVNAENAAGDKTLGEVKNQIGNQVKPFALNAPEGSPQNRFDLMNKIENLAKQPEWTGTPGLSDMKKGAKGTFPKQVGVLTDINNAIQNSADPFEAYNKIKNMAYATDNTPAANKLASFFHSASHTAREHLINASDTPQELRAAMDIHAGQTAMNASGNAFGKNKVANIAGQTAVKGGGEATLAGLAALYPALNFASIPLAVDTALTNGVTGPATARGLVNIGNKAQQTGVADILRRLGISGVQGAVNSNQAN